MSLALDERSHALDQIFCFPSFRISTLKAMTFTFNFNELYLPFPLTFLHSIDELSCNFSWDKLVFFPVHKKNLEHPNIDKLGLFSETRLTIGLLTPGSDGGKMVFKACKSKRARCFRPMKSTRRGKQIWHPRVSHLQLSFLY